MMMVMMTLFWIVPIALVVWAAVSLRWDQKPSMQAEAPLEILRRRYASGEISQEEFERARRTVA